MARFEIGDPEAPPASDLLAEMAAELNEVYATLTRLTTPPVSPDELRAPGGAYLVGWDQGRAVAGGGLRELAPGLAEIKRMYVRPEARSRGLAGELLVALEGTATTLGYRAVRLDTGPKQLHALSLYRRSGYVEIPAYNDNPWACYWAEKVLG